MAGLSIGGPEIRKEEEKRKKDNSIGQLASWLLKKGNRKKESTKDEIMNAKLYTNIERERRGAGRGGDRTSNGGNEEEEEEPAHRANENFDQ